MAIYVVLLCLIGLMYIMRKYHFTLNNRVLSKDKMLVNRKDYIPSYNMWVIAAFCIALVAFRGLSVGIDTAGYSNEFYRYDYSSLFSKRYSSERGFMLLNVVLNKLGCSFYVLTFIEALIVVLPTFFLVKKYSKNPYLSFFYFIALDYFLFSLTGMRQAFALGIVLIAFEVAQRRKFIPFICLILIAMTFHRTAIVALPIYFLEYFSLKKKHITWIILVSALVYFLKEPIREFMRQYARIDHLEIETGGTGMYLFMIAVVLVGLVFNKAKWNEKFQESIFFYMVLCAIVVYPVLQYNPTILRLHYYYSIMLIILIPNILSGIKNRVFRYTFAGLFFGVALYYMFAYPIQNMGITPYTFIGKGLY